jgi:flagellar motor switch protein FliM
MDITTPDEPIEIPAAEMPEDVSEASSAPEAASLAAARPDSKRFDFRRPAFLSSAQSRRLRMEVEEFAESLAALLSTYLRLEFTLQIGKIDTINFGEFTGSAPSPTHLTLFKLEPLRGISILEVQPALALGVVDRLLGGPGKSSTLDRNLTDMEIALMDQFVQLLLEDWCKQWSGMQSLRAEILGHENNPKFLQSSSGDTVMLAFTLDARMGECVGQMQLLFPCTVIEPLAQKLADKNPAPAPAPAAPASAVPRWNRNLENIPITLTAHWPSLKVATGVLLNLKPGEIIDLPPEGVERIELRVGSVTKFTGTMGARENKRAIQITAICKI